MEYWIAFTISLLFFGLPVLAIMGILGIWGLAHLDIGWTFLAQRRIKAIMKGESLDRIIVNVDGFHRDPAPNGKLRKVKKGESDGKSWLNRTLGIYWIGLPPFYSILTYPFSWNKWTKIGEEESYRILPRSEEVDEVMYNFPYVFRLKDVEIEGNLLVNIDLLIYLVAVNPEKMLFSSLPPGTYLAQVEASVREVVIQFAATRTLDELRELQKVSAATRAATPGTAPPPIAEEFSLAVKYVNKREKRREDGIIELLGARIDSVHFLGFDQVGSEESRRAAQAEMIAELNAKAAIAEAKGDAEAIKTRGTATAEALRLQRNAIGDANWNAQKLADALRETRAQTVVLGGQAMPTIPVSNPPPPASPPPT